VGDVSTINRIEKRAKRNMNKTQDDQFSPSEAARRRDEVIRRMANTPPQPKATTPRPSKKKKKAGAGRAAGKARARREA
jgi:hypothetical protein